MATEQERIAFCKTAAKLGYKPSELVAISHREKAAIAEGLGTAFGSVVKAIPEVGKALIGAPLPLLTAASAIGALGGAGAASIKDMFRNEYPHLFVNEASPASSELKEERLRQLIARYQNATQKVKEMGIYEQDVQNPDESPMMRYEFGGFGD